MKIMLTGATGLLGRSLSARLAARNDIDFTGLAFSRARAPLVRADLTDPDAIDTLFAERRPELVLHAAAERRPDIVDKDPGRARALNVGATANLTRACAEYGAFMIYISTDYVYDGKNPPYFPDSPVNPLNEYGRLKLAGERVAAENLGTAQRPSAKVASHDARRVGAAISPAATSIDAASAPQGLVLRIPMLYGPVERLDESPVTELAEYLRAGVPCSVDDWSTRYPLHVDEVSAAIEILIDTWAHNPEKIGEANIGSERDGGLPLFLLSGPVGMTKYGMILAMAKALGADASFVRAIREPAASGAPRPKDCRMDTGRLKALGYAPHIVFPEGLTSILGPFFARPAPHPAP